MVVLCFCLLLSCLVCIFLIVLGVSMGVTDFPMSSSSSASSVSSSVPVVLTRYIPPSNTQASRMPPGPPSVSPPRPPSPEEDTCIICLMPIYPENNGVVPEPPHDPPSPHTTTTTTTTTNTTPPPSPEELSTLEEGRRSPTTPYCCTSTPRRRSPPPHSPLPSASSSSPSSSSHTKPSSQPFPIPACTCQPTIHPSCFHEWCMTNPVCPICRAPLANATEYIRWSESASSDSTVLSSRSSRRSRSPTVSVSCKVLMGMVFFGWVMMRILDPLSYPDDLPVLPNQSNLSHSSLVNDTLESPFVWIIPP